ncbi:MAG: SEC-C metal-binding domain-containing protein [Vicinamibacterales bacterium]
MTSTSVRPGRNEPCSCGSGRKYKQCCLAKDEATAAAARAAKAAQDAENAAAAPTADEESTPSPKATPVRVPKHQTRQPWKAATSRGFAPKNRMPRKAGGS